MFVKIAITCHGDPRDIGRHRGPNSSIHKNRFCVWDDHESMSFQESWVDINFNLQNACTGTKSISGQVFKNRKKR